jgi:hypothetical protein
LCGITVAPIIPIAIYAASLGIEGINPNKLYPVWLSKYHFEYKGKPMIATNTMIKASIFRMPLLIKK